MTEAEWLACENVHLLLGRLQRPQQDRKARLFACACCRQVWESIPDPILWTAVEVSERFADQQATLPQLRAAARKARQVEQRLRQAVLAGALSDGTSYSAASAASLVALKGILTVLMGVRSAGVVLTIREEPNTQSSLFREIFGNPFRPITFAPEWKIDTAVALAGQMYESRDFSAMPILADALQDAGCDSEDILSHCRGEGPHVRGCWVVDLVLGRE